MDKTERIRELVKLLNEASRAYYQEDREIMSNLEYDALYDELCLLEEETGIVMSNSPTVKVGYEVVSELPKEAHPSPMLSLDKTKEVESLKDWLGDKDGILSWKMDGLTVVLTYRDGTLEKAVTRGNGEVGEVITNNARVFKNIPHRISYKGALVIRGEAVIKYSDFEKINAEIEDVESKYKNPRNLCSGSVRQLNNEITAKRNVNFFAFSLSEPEDTELYASFGNSFENEFKYLKELGFDVVEYRRVNAQSIEDGIRYFAEKISENDFPSDGLVLTYDDMEYGKSLGRTAKFPRNAIAFKWADEQADTTLRKVEWSPSRTGLINPIAVFDPVSLEGTTVTRASLHNVSIVKGLRLGIGDTVSVYKANMIIPQIAENKTCSDNLEIPDTCPSCGGETVIKSENGVETLVCPNRACPAKNIKLFTHFVSRNAMNIDGMSEATLEKFIDEGYIKKLYDIYRISRYEAEITRMEGFGEKSYSNMIKAIDASRNAGMDNFIYALGIPNVGFSNARVICRHFKYDLEKIMSAEPGEYTDIDGIGEVIALSMTGYFADTENMEVVRELLKEISFAPVEEEGEQDLEGLTFVITGSLMNFINRDELKNLIEKRGGKVAGSVSAKTSYLINNDITSQSSKNKKAKSLNVPIITEEDFLNM